ncbi:MULTISPECIES: hypothetical protein [unclassified Rhizobium]|uniref:hypothetical protein n=1 Tax=unclassified Rhizobium TaxID=2613769 RepID=UPI00179D988F|nr:MULTISPECIES: hypothetical protein [unclassified Rhizobium]MBB3386240.1 histidinol phosphatase-like enzyme [Rhizobium sp. BK098]MBB3571760.1 histidinol phosphatase-like enzyme [Rhizobium sp. BK491]MBB3617944.1 histidinol phosphatase-like enzyme [Rhizobium sp. BK609]MBB3683603.1 histidinol phosphatase-like enzyme [Rhizobium sp. BK612]
MSSDGQSMNFNARGLHCVMRRIGCASLVIFDRDGLLLSRKSPSRDLMLGDVSDEFVEMLRELRELNLRFGFISDERGMDAVSYGRSEFTTLTSLLDELLRIRSAMPDFWMTWSELSGNRGSKLRHRDDWRQKRGAGMIRRSIELYGIDNRETVFVSASAAGLLAANTADVTFIQVVGQGSDCVMPRRMETEAQQPSQSTTTEIGRLRATIEQILGLPHRAGHHCIGVRSE